MPTDSVFATSPIRLGGKRYAPGDRLPLTAEEAEAEGLARHVDVREEEKAPEGDAPEQDAPTDKASPDAADAAVQFEDIPSHDDLKAAGVETIEAVGALSEDELLDIDGIGPATATKILDALATA